MSVIFVKTPKGTEEMTARSGGLTPRVRRVLIMIDGKRTVDDLRAMALADDLSHTIGELEEAGFIEMLKQADSPAPAADGGLPAITTFREIPAEPSAKDLDMARNFIMNTLKTFCGQATHLSIIEAVFAAQTHEAMREQFAPWYNAIVETRAGHRRAEELRAELLKVI